MSNKNAKNGKPNNQKDRGRNSNNSNRNQRNTSKKPEQSASTQKDAAASRWMSDSKTRNANDIRWYAGSPEQLKAAASISWTGFAGQKLFDQDNSIPGIMVLDWAPTIGGENFTAVNQAANSIYSYVVHANSRNYKYDAPDLMLMILAGANVFSGFAEGVRVFGIMNRYNGVDLYTPQALVKALGFNFDDLQKNLSQMWFDLNHLVGQLQQIWIPNVMPVVERWFWLNSNIYRDAESAKAQYYIFRQETFYTLSETIDSNGTALVPNSVQMNRPLDRTWSEYMQMMNEMIDALVNAQDRGMIFGDILNAYGADKLYAVSPIDVDYQTPVSYNTEVLSQIENATVCQTSVGNIVQDMNHVRISQNYMVGTYETFANAKVGTKFLPDDGLLNFHQLSTPTPEQIMIASRLRSAGLMIQDVDLSDPNHYKISLKPVVNGTEIVTGISVYFVTYTSGVAQVGGPVVIDANIGDASIGSLHNIYNWCSFDWAPWIYQTTNNPRTIPTKPAPGRVLQRLQPEKLYGDWDNWSVITREELAKLHTTALLSEFGVPITI